MMSLFIIKFTGPSPLPFIIIFFLKVRGRKEKTNKGWTPPDPLLFQPSPALSPPPAPNPHCKDLASIVLEFQYCSENEKALNAIRGQGEKEHLAPLGQLKMPFILAESSVIDPVSQRLGVPVPGRGWGWGEVVGGEEGEFQLKANSLL